LLPTSIKREIKLLILDEPVANLDIHSIHDQIQIISRIQQLPHSPALLIISHIYVDKLLEKLSNSQLIML
jgi:ABC-type molybdenum transport system ATPase subunit/photorepair protein PhrA